MLIHDCMTRHPATVFPTTSVVEAQHAMSENHIRHLPVVGDGKRLAGLITRQTLSLKPDMIGSLGVWEITRYLADLKVREIMIKAPKVFTVTQEMTVERAAAIMTKEKIGCLPVLDQNKLVVGIVTQVDLLRSFQEMLGLPTTGVRVTVQTPDKPGEFIKLMNVVAQQEWCVMGIGTFPVHRRPGYYRAVLKIPNVTLEDVKAAFSNSAEHEIVDIRTIV